MLPKLSRLTQVAGRLWEKYGNAHKADNALLLEQQRLVGAETVTARPWRLILDPNAGCNIRCTDCGAHTGSLPRGSLSPENVERFLADLWSTLVQVNLFHWGEPFLNRNIHRVVSAIHSHGVGTQIHTNMNHLPEEMARGVIEGGLDFLVASIDGITQPVYEQYRRGGNVEKAIANLRRFVALRRELNSPTPRIIWRYLCFPHALPEIDAARMLAREIGVDDFALGDGALHGQWWTINGPRPLNPIDWPDGRPTFPLCEEVYDFPVIHFDGKILPCCYVSDQRYIWADLTRQRWDEAFNSESFRQARRFLAGDTAVATPCTGCFKLAALRGKVQSA